MFALPIDICCSDFYPIVIYCCGDVLVHTKHQYFFFFMQKTAYEMRISDWSSDVCSSDLLNGEGEVAGGIVILRSGKNAREAIAAVKDKLDTLKASLPPGVEVITTYDRSELIDRAVENLTHKLLEEFVVVAIVCALFLWHEIGRAHV